MIAEDTPLGRTTMDFRCPSRWRYSTVQVPPVAVDYPLNDGREVLEEVEAVRNLHGSRQTPFYPFGIGTCPVPADDLHAWVLLQPSGHRIRRAIGQQVDDAVAL